MRITLAFDVYGTLINTNGVVTELKELVDDKAEEFSRTWRQKQLEYSFRRGLMQRYENFSICIMNALDYTCAHYNVQISKEQKHQLLEIYNMLPIFADVKESLNELNTAGFHSYAFSNGSKDTVERLLTTATIREFFLGIISVEDQKTFKPNPIVYNYFLSKTGATKSSTWLISSNPFDVIGAICAGIKAVWLRRSQETIYDPWNIEPTIIVSSFSEIKKKIEEYSIDH
jgi:2-haloacid dehalogenase